MDNRNSKEHLIIGTQLKKARELLQMRDGEVAQEIKVSQQDIISWEEELTQPNLKQLEDLGKLYGREIDYFLRKTPDLPEKIEFRGKQGESLRDLPQETKIVLSRFDELCRTALEFESLLNKKHEVKLPKFEESDSPKIVAQSLRKRFKADNKPLPELRNRLEGEGIRIFELPIPEDAFSGFSFWHTEYGPCILLNANELKGRKNFTLAHELSHLLYSHTSGICCIPPGPGEIHRGIEYNANQFAIELLLPEKSVTEDFRKKGFSSTPSEKELAQMAYSKWGVSIQALGYRLESLGLLQSGYTNTLLETKPLYFRGRKGRRTPKWEKQLGREFVKTTFDAYQKGLISPGKIAQGLGITVREALNEIDQRDNQRID